MLIIYNISLYMPRQDPYLRYEDQLQQTVFFIFYINLYTFICHWWNSVIGITNRHCYSFICKDINLSFVLLQFQSWAFTNQIALGESFGAASSVVTSAMANLEWGNSRSSQIYDFLLTANGASSIVAPLILVFAAMFAHFIH